MLLPPLAAPPTASLDDARDALARKFYDQLRGGAPDPALLTDDARYYFTPGAIADYRDSLAPLGAPAAIKPLGKARLRGGFVNRNYEIDYAGHRLLAVTYAEPGADGRFEQFIVMPFD